MPAPERHHRRRAPACLRLPLLLASLMLAGAVAATELRIVAPAVPGSSWDQLAQALKSALAETESGSGWAEIRNLPGGGGTAGLAQFLTEAGDGDLLVTGLTMVDACILQRVPVKVDQLTPIARLSAEPFVVAVPAGSPFKAIAELKAEFASDPAKVTWAGGPAGGTDHVAAIVLAQALGIDPARFTYVPFLASGDAAAALGEGKVGAAMLLPSELAGEVKAGRVRLLALSSDARIEGETLPTLAENGIAVELSNWRGVMARPGLSLARRAELVARVEKALASPTWRDALEKRGWRGAYLSGEAFGTFVASEQARVKAALRGVGLLKRVEE